MTEEEKIFKGEMFSPGAQELRAIKLRSHNLSQEYSNTKENETEKRAALAQEILAEYGEGSFMQGPIFFHYGKHTRVGKRCFFNYNLTVQDDAPVVIGDDCNFGPNVTIVTPVHPMLPDERKRLRTPEGEIKRMCYAKGVTIGLMTSTISTLSFSFSSILIFASGSNPGRTLDAWLSSKSFPPNSR